MTHENPELIVAVSVDKVIHEAFATIAQNIFDQHGIQVLGVTVEWLDTSTLAGSATLVAGVGMETRKRFA